MADPSPPIQPEEDSSCEGLISFPWFTRGSLPLAEERKRTLVGLFGRTWAPATLGLMLIAIVTFPLMAAIVEHRRSLNELHGAGARARR